MDWTSVYQQRHNNAVAALHEAAESASISVPVATGRHNIPGWRFLGEFFYTYQDVTYPWDPAVVRAIRRIQADVVPLTVRSVWKQQDYGNAAHRPPVVITNHVVARALRNPIAPFHLFRCEQPYTPHSIMRCDAHILVDPRPNYIEVKWHDRRNREYGPDMPGRYLAHDWELYRVLADYHIDFGAMKQTPAEWAREELIAPDQAMAARRSRYHADEFAAFQRDQERFYCVEPSSVELKNAMMGDAPAPSKPFTMAVPSGYPAE